MTHHVINFSSIIIPPHRQRINLDPEYIVELADSITDNGLFHPPIVRGANDKETASRDPSFDWFTLVAGECRLKAIDLMWQMGRKLKYGQEELPINHVPVNFLGELDHITTFRAELDENIRRRDLSWQDRVRAVSQLAELMRLESQRDNRPAPTIAVIAKESRPDMQPGAAHDAVRKELIVSRNLDNPLISKAKNVDEAFKILKREEDLQKAEDLAKEIGATFSSASHVLLLGDCLDKCNSWEPESFDCVLTDPPYGIGAQDFGDSDGLAQGAHFYDDQPEMFKASAPKWIDMVSISMKPISHLYWFCDIDWFPWLKHIAQSSGLKPFRTPLIWVNPSGQRAPWPHSGPQRKWQAILYATKGDRPCRALAPDVLTWPSDPNLNHPAQKPVALYTDLLRRSCNPGDRVLDPFAGTGTIFPAAHSLKIFATGVEKNQSAYGIAVRRLKELK
jgi:DNA modification methylase